MSQEIRVVQCIECSLYQVDIVKKKNNWECKVCRQKQVVRREFFRGNGAECRLKVQQLNLVRGQERQVLDDRKIIEIQHEEDRDGSDTQLSERPKEAIKWTAFVDEPIQRVSEIGRSPDKTNQQEPEGSETQWLSSTHTKGASKWAAFVNEPIQRVSVIRRSPKANHRLEYDDLDSSLKSNSRSSKRTAGQTIVSKKPNSKWQKFV